jgi:hypothetical protein
MHRLLGHAHPTTADNYVRGSPADLDEKLKKAWGE